MRIAVYILAQQSGTNIWLCVYVPYVCFVCASKKIVQTTKLIYYNCLIHFYSELIWKTTFDGRQPSMDVALRWKTTFDGRRTLTEDNLL